MFKRASLATAAALAALIALPTASQAGHCKELDRMGAGLTRIFHDMDRSMHRLGKRMTRRTDRTLGMLFHDRRRKH